VQELEQNNRFLKESHANLESLNKQHQDTSLALKKEVDSHKDRHSELLQNLQQQAQELSNAQSKLQVLE